MPDNAQSARDDVAFLRTLMDGGGSLMPALGEAYFAAGVIYGGEMLLHACQAAGWLPLSGLGAWFIGLGPTVLFLPIIVWINWRHRADRPPAAVGRAIGAVFGAIGIANVALAAVVGIVAFKEHSFTTWFIFPCAVLVLQGTAWCVMTLLRRRLWMAAVALGWIAAALGMALNVGSIGPYLAFAGAGFWLCMALPGWLMMRHYRQGGGQGDGSGAGALATA